MREVFFTARKTPIGDGTTVQQHDPPAVLFQSPAPIHAIPKSSIWSGQPERGEASRRLRCGECVAQASRTAYPPHE